MGNLHPAPQVSIIYNILVHKNKNLQLLKLQVNNKKKNGAHLDTIFIIQIDLFYLHFIIHCAETYVQD